MALGALAAGEYKIRGGLLNLNLRAGSIDQERTQNQGKSDSDSDEDGAKGHGQPLGNSGLLESVQAGNVWTVTRLSQKGGNGKVPMSQLEVHRVCRGDVQKRRAKSRRQIRWDLPLESARSEICEVRAAYLPDFAGAETGAVSPSTEWLCTERS